MYSFDLENKVLCGRKTPSIYGRDVTLGSALVRLSSYKVNIYISNN
jgi:hypothetical protein